MTILSLLALLLSTAPETPEPSATQHGFNALVFSRTVGFRHDSIDEGIAAITALGSSHDFSVTATEDPSVFSSTGLVDYDVVVFLNTTGDILNTSQQAALEGFVASGGGWVGIHSAADTEYGWDWYGGLVGAWFQAHPATQPARVRVLDRDHPSTEHLPQVWTRTDEWYDYRTNPRGDVHVLATMDVDSYSGHGMGHDHPIAWCRSYEGGRSWYTGMGHTPESFSEQDYLDHLLGGIEWAAGAQDGVCNATIGSKYDLETLDDNVDSPIDLVVAPSGEVFFVELGGAVKMYDPVGQSTSTVAEIDVFQAFEDGLIGITLDPAFERNNWVYLFYSPAGPEAKQHVSRFTWTGSELDLGSEVVILEIPTQRDECCHSGGDMRFGPNGELFIAVGDNTNPFDSDGFAPIDERQGRAPWDAQKSSGNVDDLRGKILRIVPTDAGSYEIPDGNLFPAGSGGRPEIYVMGVRNPFRISYDDVRGWLYWGDVGPDAAGASPQRGPAGLDEWNQARSAGNYGWPYCIGDNVPYRDWDFATGSASGTFDCASLVNDSPNNTGQTSLPPARPAWIWYPYGASTEFPGITADEGRSAMAGPVYRQVPGTQTSEGLPAYFEDRLLIYEWSRSYIRVVTLDQDGAPLSIDPFPGDPDLKQPISMDVGPDGSLYLLEWGTGFGRGNPDARLSRISFASLGRKPVAVVSASVTSGPLPLEVSFSATGSYDPDGDTLLYEWDLDGDGTTDATGTSADWTYTQASATTVELVVTDSFGNSSRASLVITAGNSRPEVTIQRPSQGGVFAWGDRVPFSITVNDAEDGSTADGSIDCGGITVSVFLGHDEHTHPLENVTGCEGILELETGHGTDGDRLFHVVEATFSDAGAGNAPPIQVIEERVLFPSRLEVEYYDEHQGIQTEATGDDLGGRTNIGFLDHGDWIRFDGLSLEGVDFLTFRVASAGTGGRIEVRRGAVDGPLVAEASVPRTGGWQDWVDVTTPVVEQTGQGAVYLIFLNRPGDSGLFNVNYLIAHGAGVSERIAGSRGLRANYSNTAGASLERVDPQLSFNWGADGPLGGGDFRAEWEGIFTAPLSGTYGITLRGQGSAELFLDGASTATLSSLSSVGEQRSGVRLRANQEYEIRVTYAGASNAASLWVELDGGGYPSRPIGEATTVPAGGSVSTEDPTVPTAWRVAPVYPNPAAGDANLEVALPSALELSVQVFDLLGRRVAEVFDGTLPAGVHALSLPVGGLAPGAYYVTVRTTRNDAVRSLIKTR